MTTTPSIAGFESFVEIGRGGYGVVYRAWETALQRQVAIKLLWANLDQTARDRFTREGLAMSALSGHPNVLAVHQVGVTDDGQPFLVMPYLERGSLHQLLTAMNGRGLAWEDATRYTIRLSGALATAHAAGILHRDIKPANVLLSDYGEPELADFGIARMTGGFETTEAGIAASVLHAAPEILNRQPATVASDLYSLGSMLFALLYGRAAFLPTANDEVVAVYVSVLRDPVPDLRPFGVPDAVCRVIEQSMEKEPANRQRSAAELGQQLQSAQQLMGTAVTEMAITATAASTGTDVGVTAPSPVMRETTPSAVPPPVAVGAPTSAPTPTPDTSSQPKRGARVAIGVAAAIVVLAALAIVTVLVVRRPADSASPPGSPATAIPGTITLSPTPISVPLRLDAGGSRQLKVEATAGQRITGQVRFDPAPPEPVPVRLTLGEAAVVDQTSVGGLAEITPTVLPDKGTYMLQIGPTSAATDATVDIVQAVDPVERSTTIDGPPVHIELVQARQEGVVSFDGKAGQSVQGEWRWTGQRGISSTAQIFDANGTELDAWTVGDGNSRGKVITLPADGQYRLRVGVDGTATGSGDVSIRSA